MSAPSQLAEAIVGGYRLGKLLDEGGQGRVFHATRLSDGLGVAMKLYELPTESRLQDKARRQHQRESKALRGISSPAIVRIEDDGQHLEPIPLVTAGCLWTAFEFVDGRHLRHMMSLSRVELTKVLAALSRLAEGLDHVHATKIVHRDIKPENIILRGKKWDEPVLVDFGFAKRLDASRLTVTGFHPGTRFYTAPEIQRDAKAEAASDQWSFARLSAELLLWAWGEDFDDISESDARDDITGRFSDCPSAAEVLSRALEPEPEDRFEDVSSFVSALEEALTTTASWNGNSRCRASVSSIGTSASR